MEGCWITNCDGDSLYMGGCRLTSGAIILDSWKQWLLNSADFQSKNVAPGSLTQKVHTFMTWTIVSDKSEESIQIYLAQYVCSCSCALLLNLQLCRL